MKRSGFADLPLHGGKVPFWLADRMGKLGAAITEAVIYEYGRTAFLSRFSDPFWFQSFGAVLGMDWHSSGITTSVMGALKKSLNHKAHELGLYFCGGKGKSSRQTPAEILKIADKNGLNGTELIYASRLSAKVDNTAIQDGFQLYLHCFIVTIDGEWAVVQQGMNKAEALARRYHWHSKHVSSFTETPHSSIYGKNQGLILNLTDKLATPTKEGILKVAAEDPQKMLPEIAKLIMPFHHEVQAKDISMKRLGAAMTIAWERQVKDFESILMLEGVGPRTIQSLALVSEVIHGTPTRFSDPARFSFAHGGKDKHPFPVPTNVYDESIEILKNSVEKAKIGLTDKQKALKALHTLTLNIEKNFEPNFNFNEIVDRERKNSYKYGGRSVFGKEIKPDGEIGQLGLFD